MSHTFNNPPLKYAQADLPDNLPEGTYAYDSTNSKMVAYRNGQWGDFGGGVTIPETVVYDFFPSDNLDIFYGEQIPNNWKENQSELEGLVIGNGVTDIGDFAFKDCFGLTGDLVIPDSVTSIGQFAFQYCSGLTGTLTIPNSVTTIGIYAFGNCGFTGPLVLPNSVTSIEANVFVNCTGLTGDLVIPDSVTSIGQFAFNICSGLTKAIIPSSVTYMGLGVFEGCSNMTTVDCYVAKSIFDDGIATILNTAVTTIHVRSTDSTWTAGAGQTIGGKSGITVIKDL